MLIIAARLCFPLGADVFVWNSKTKALKYFTPCTNSFVYWCLYEEPLA